VVFKSLAQVIPFPTYRALESFCSRGAFPMEPLAAKKVTPEGVNFLKTLLVADPKDRLTAKDALDAEWLQTSDAIRPQEAEVSRQEVAGIEDTLVGRRAFNFTDTSNLGHKHHKGIGIQPQASPQDTKRSTSKDSGAMGPQDASNYSHPHGPELAQSTQDGKTTGKLQRVSPILQKNDDKTYRASEFGKDSIIRVPKSSVSLISEQMRDTGDLNSGQDLNKSPTDRDTPPLRPQDNKKQESSQIPLHTDIALRAIQRAQATELLRKNGFNIYAANFSANTALFWAAQNGHETVVKLLLATDGIDPDSKDSNNRRTPLSWAAQNGHETVVKLLLAANGVDPDSKSYFGSTPLSWAAQNGHEAVVKLLLAADGVDPDSKNNREQTPLSWAARNGHEAVVKLLLTTDGVDPDSNSDDRRTPLSWAAQNGHEAVVKLLLTTDGMNPDSKSNDRRTPLSWAAQNGHEAVVKLLLATDGIDPDSKDIDYGQTPLSWAAQNGHEAVVKLLLTTDGVDPDSKGYFGSTSLSWAAQNGHEAVVKLLLTTDGVDPDFKSNDRRTPLSWAAQNGHETVVKLLLAVNGVDPDSKDHYGQTPLSWAAENGHEAVVKLLLAADGVDPDSKDHYGQTPLSWAAEEGHEAVVKLLQSPASSINQTNQIWPSDLI
jgi:ankyrin repeat protein